MENKKDKNYVISKNTKQVKDFIRLFFIDIFIKTVTIAVVKLYANNKKYINSELFRESET